MLLLLMKYFHNISSFIDYNIYISTGVDAGFRRKIHTRMYVFSQGCFIVRAVKMISMNAMNLNIFSERIDISFARALRLFSFSLCIQLV